jgi:hypothetical protein
MAENFTLHKYRVLKELPNGHLPGDVIEETEDVGTVLMTAGVEAVERVPDDTPVGRPSFRNTYRRRDLVADKPR